MSDIKLQLPIMPPFGHMRPSWSVFISGYYWQQKYASNVCLLFQNIREQLVIYYIKYICSIKHPFSFIYVCQSVCLSNYLSVQLSVCPTICLSIYCSAHTSLCPSISQPIYLSAHLSLSPSISLSIYLSAHLSVSPCICLNICLSLSLTHFSLVTRLSFFLSFCLSVCLSVCLSDSLRPFTSLHSSAVIGQLVHQNQTLFAGKLQPCLQI